MRHAMEHCDIGLNFDSDIVRAVLSTPREGERTVAVSAEPTRWSERMLAAADRYLLVTL